VLRWPQNYTADHRLVGAGRASRARRSGARTSGWSIHYCLRRRGRPGGRGGDGEGVRAEAGPCVVTVRRCGARGGRGGLHVVVVGCMAACWLDGCDLTFFRFRPGVLGGVGVWGCDCVKKEAVPVVFTTSSSMYR
jgi:hypothetical protein